MKASFVDVNRAAANSRPDRCHKIEQDKPSVLQLNSMAPGDYMKVCSSGEFLSARVREVNDDQVVARIENETRLFHRHGLKSGDCINVEKRHIYEVSQQGWIVDMSNRYIAHVESRAVWRFESSKRSNLYGEYDGVFEGKK